MVMDLIWAVGRIMQMEVRKLYSTIPLRPQLRIVDSWGWIRRRMKINPRRVGEWVSGVMGDYHADSEIQVIIERQLEFLSRSSLVRLLSWRNSFEKPDKWTVEGLEHLEGAIAKKRGAILVTAHLGHPRLIGPVLRSYGYRIRQVVAASSDYSRREGRLNSWVASGGKCRRMLLGPLLGNLTRQDHIVAGLDVRPIFQALHNNELVSLAGDGGIATEFVRVPLLGRSYPFPSGYVKIAMMTGAPLVPVFMIEKARAVKLALEIHPELPIDPVGEVIDNIGLFAKVVEEQLERHPHQWYRWKKLYSSDPISSNEQDPQAKDKPDCKTRLGAM